MIFRPEARLALLAALLLTLVWATACKNRQAPITTSPSDEITVAAASDLTPAFEEIGRAGGSVCGGEHELHRRVGPERSDRSGQQSDLRARSHYVMDAQRQYVATRRH